MTFLNIGNMRRINDIGQFSHELVTSACLERWRRGDADEVYVVCEVTPFPDISGVDVSYFRTRVHFDKTIRGFDCERRDRVVYEEIGSVECRNGSFNVEGYTKDFLHYLAEEVGKQKPSLPTSIEGNTLIVKSAFSHVLGGTSN